MLPIPTALSVLSNASDTAQTVFSAFIPYAWLDIGVLIAVLVILLVIAAFSGAMGLLLAGISAGHSAKDTLNHKMNLPYGKEWID